MTAHERLEELAKYIDEQIYVETCRPTYNGEQRAIAYRRVLRRLKPILRQAKLVRRTFCFESE